MSQRGRFTEHRLHCHRLEIFIAKLIEYKRIGPDGKPKKEEETDKKVEFVQQERKKDLGKIKQDFDKNIILI